MNPLLESQMAKDRYDEMLRNVMNEKAYLKRQPGRSSSNPAPDRWVWLKRISYGLALIGIIGFFFVRLIVGF
jgi:hypothetical protein